MMNKRSQKLNHQRNCETCHENLTRTEIILLKTVAVRIKNSLKSWSSLTQKFIQTNQNQLFQNSYSNEFLIWNREKEFNNQKTASFRLYVNIHLQIHEEENVDKMQDISSSVK